MTIWIRTYWHRPSITLRTIVTEVFVAKMKFFFADFTFWKWHFLLFLFLSFIGRKEDYSRL